MPLQRTTVTPQETRRKQEFREASKGCEMYDPDPINYKCMNRATHLYKRCQECPIPKAHHSYKTKAWAIRRENFAITVSDEVGKEFLKLSEENKNN